MIIKEWINKTNNLIPSAEKYIIGFQRITKMQLSYNEAIEDIENLKLEHIENKKANNIIEELIINTTIYSKNSKGCFHSLYFKKEFATNGLTTLNHLKEFGKLFFF